MFNKINFLKDSENYISYIYDEVNNNKSMSIYDLAADKTALIIMDMVNGFVKEGALSSDRILNINEKIADLSRVCSKLNIEKLAFADCHEADCKEFLSYPVHCLKDSNESKVTCEILNTGDITIINKNSTNGYLEPEFKQFLLKRPMLDTFIIVGDCTDICVKQFALTMKADFNRMNKDLKIIIPMNLVETYDNDSHNANLLNIISLYDMMINGIDICKEIKF